MRAVSRRRKVVTPISDTKSNQIFNTVPINASTRSIWRLLTLTPGVVGGGFAYTIGRNNRYTDSTFTIDGVPMIDGWSGGAIGPAFTFLDAYREFRVDVAGTNASVGTTAGMAVVSESGTNTLHGEGWLHYNAIGFVARPFFAPRRPSGPPIYRPNVKIGGPIRLGPLCDGRDRSFFHFTWQALRGSQLPQVTNMVVPSPAFRGGNFSALTSVINDPLSRAPFAGNQIPASRISSVSKYFQDTYYLKTTEFPLI